jgi:hypothetical protein
MRNWYENIVSKSFGKVRYSMASWIYYLRQIAVQIQVSLNSEFWRNTYGVFSDLMLCLNPQSSLMVSEFLISFTQ